MQPRLQEKSDCFDDLSQDYTTHDLDESPYIPFPPTPSNFSISPAGTVARVPSLNTTVPSPNTFVLSFIIKLRPDGTSIELPSFCTTTFPSFKVTVSLTATACPARSKTSPSSNFLLTPALSTR